MSAAVLVVDDEDAVRSSEADILRAAGYEVAEAADGFEAMVVLRTGRVDAMVLDLRMPGCDGMTLIDALDDPPPIVIVSAHALAGQELARLQGKVGAVLTKPVPPPRLLDEVRSAVGGEKA